MFYISKGNIVKWCIIVLCVVIAVILISQHKIFPWRVEKISAPGGTLSAEDAEKFIWLFNLAQYKGRGTGEGGTPDIQVYVYYKDGSYLIISEFGGKGKNFEVSLRNADGKHTGVWYYVNSEALEQFVLELIDEAN